MDNTQLQDEELKNIKVLDFDKIEDVITRWGLDYKTTFKRWVALQNKAVRKAARHG